MSFRSCFRSCLGPCNSTAVAAALLFLGISVSDSPAAPRQDGTLRVETQLVLVDVVVTDDQGAVSDLTENDFRVLDDGVEQTISVFEAVSSVSAEESAPLTGGVVSNYINWQGRVPNAATVILVDRVNTPTEAQVFTNQRLSEFLASFDQTDGIAVYELRSDGLHVVHEFTEDPQEMLPEVAAMEVEHSLTLSSSDSSSGFESSLDSVGLDRGLSDDFFTATPDAGRLSSDYFLNDRALKTSSALETIALRLKGVRGRKNLVWLSGRFPFTFDVWTRTDLEQEIERSTMAQIEEVGISLTEANIAIYPVDVRGPEGEGADVGSVVEKLSVTSGGRSFRTNDVGNAIQSAINDSKVVYTLGFYPSKPAKDRNFRRIRVEVAGDGRNVRHRPGYYGIGAEKDAVPTPGLADLLSSPLDATGVRLTGAARPLADGSGGYQLVLLVKVDDLTLVDINDRKLGVIDLQMFFRSSEDGSIYALRPQTRPVNLSAESFAQAQRVGFPVILPLQTEGRTGALRVAVQDQATGAGGSLWVPVGTE